MIECRILSKIERLSPAETGPELWGELHAFSTALLRELWPDDPPLPPSETRRRLSSASAGRTVIHLAARVPGEPGLAALGRASWARDGRAASVNVDVRAGLRRRGLGREMLSALLDALPPERSSLGGMTNGRVPGGEAFARFLGAERRVERTVHQLDLRELDAGLLERWGALAPGFATGAWDGPFPEKALAELAELHALIVDEPGRPAPTAASLREQERLVLAGGARQWTFWAAEPGTGRLAAFMTLHRGPDDDARLSFGSAAVRPEHRGKGLAKRLKSLALSRVLAEAPGARFVRTANADRNAPMLAVNASLGFKPYVSLVSWSVETAAARARLAAGR